MQGADTKVIVCKLMTILRNLPFAIQSKVTRLYLSLALVAYKKKSSSEIVQSLFGTVLSVPSLIVICMIRTMKLTLFAN